MEVSREEFEQIINNETTRTIAVFDLKKSNEKQKEQTLVTYIDKQGAFLVNVYSTNLFNTYEKTSISLFKYAGFTYETTNTIKE